MNADLIELINDQIQLARDNFVETNCQIADDQVDEMFGDDERVLLSITIEGDDGRTYNRYLDINIGDEDHTLINKGEFTAISASLEDWNDQLQEL